MTKFSLINETDNQEYGKISFNGKFVFDLNHEIDLGDWNRIGFIKLDSTRHIESTNLFEHLNSRLPITLRGEPNDAKLEYIKQTGLRVASDNFYLRLDGESA